MTDLTSLGTLAALPIASVIAGVVLWISFRLQTKHPVADAGSSLAAAEFLVCDGKLVDNNPSIEPCPFGRARKVDTWGELKAWLEPRFGPLPSNLDRLAPGESLKRLSRTQMDRGLLTITHESTKFRVALTNRDGNDAKGLHRISTREGAVSPCLDVLENAPYAIQCKCLETGEVWQNEAFEAFTDSEVKELLAASDPDSNDTLVQLNESSTELAKSYRVQRAGNETTEVIYLLDVTEVARAEHLRKEFIQTLTKIFANLTTGLAVFDRHQQLALFNPALLDLTQLPATFLSSKPTITQFFDRLRDNRILPEPKNYGTWRNQIDEMIRSASDGLYFEDWSLPNGETYRVAGRPHPDGAIAFLFEDISDEIALTRRFRSQIDIRQAALDTCDQAITIIGPQNVVLLCNERASSMLGVDPDSSFADVSIHDLLQACAKQLPHDRFWALAEAKILSRDTSEAVIADVGGRAYKCRIKPIRGNSVLVSISTEPDQVRGGTKPKSLTA